MKVDSWGVIKLEPMEWVLPAEDNYMQKDIRVTYKGIDIPCTGIIISANLLRKIYEEHLKELQDDF